MKIKPKQRVVPLPDISFKLDHRAYFRDFCEANGEPVEYQGRLDRT